MTKSEAAIVSAYTGILIGKFSDMHEFIEKILDRPVYTHELGDTLTVIEIKKFAKPYFMALKVE